MKWGRFRVHHRQLFRCNRDIHYLPHSTHEDARETSPCMPICDYPWIVTFFDKAIPVILIILPHIFPIFACLIMFFNTTALAARPVSSTTNVLYMTLFILFYQGIFNWNNNSIPSGKIKFHWNRVLKLAEIFVSILNILSFELFYENAEFKPPVILQEKA